MSTHTSKSRASSLFNALWGVVVFAALIAPRESISQGLEPAWENYVHRVSKAAPLIFVAACEKAPGSKVALIVPYKREMMLVEWDDHGIANLAEVRLQSQSNDLVIGETSGGIYSYQRAQSVLDAVGKMSFHRMSPKLLLGLDISADEHCGGRQ